MERPGRLPGRSHRRRSFWRHKRDLFARRTVRGFRPSTTVMSANPQPERGRFVAPDAALALLKPGEDLVVESCSMNRRWPTDPAQFRRPWPDVGRPVSPVSIPQRRPDDQPGQILSLQMTASPAAARERPGADIISVHEDRDGDGTYEIHRRVLTG